MLERAVGREFELVQEREERGRDGREEEVLLGLERDARRELGCDLFLEAFFELWAWVWV